jgi:hypothetical protein
VNLPKIVSFQIVAPFQVLFFSCDRSSEPYPVFRVLIIFSLLWCIVIFIFSILNACL